MKNLIKGVLYIAFGKVFVKECLFSIQSLKRYNPDIPIALFTDCEVNDSSIDILEIIKPKHLRSKVDFVSQSPFEKTLYLDSDTVIVHDISDMFDILDRFDVGITHDYARKRQNYCHIKEYSDIPYSFSEVNGGIMSFNNSDRVKEFLNLWNKKFYQYKDQTSGWDQPTLRIALWQSKVKIHHYPPEYNIRPKHIREKVRHNKGLLGKSHLSPRIYHAHYSHDIHNGKYEVNSLEQLEKVVIERSLEI